MWKKIGRRLLLAVVILAKFSKILKVLKVLKALKVVKPCIMLISLILSTMAYSECLNSTILSLGLIIILAIHESGHILAMKRKGIATSWPVFIPMLGAVVFMPKVPSPEDEAYIAYGGPLTGLLFSVLLFSIGISILSVRPILLQISFLSSILNLFNMLPVRPIDGGRVTQIVGDWFKYLGLGLLVIITIITKNPSLLIIWILVIDDVPIPNIAKVVISSFCEVFLVGFIIAGFGEKKLWLNLVDIVLGLLFLSKYWACHVLGITEESGDEEKLTAKENNQAPICGSVRRKWLVRYLILLTALILLTVLHAPFMLATTK